jgi:DnaJ-class molecular chaperone
MMYYNPEHPRTTCFTCHGRGLVYEVEYFPSDPDSPCVNAETCPDCLGACYVKQE